MRGIAVIGANYGDEGKGLMTDYLARKYHVKQVVRTNGGGQAAHTVQLPDGTRHVFSHMSSGTLMGADTVFGPKFILNPVTFEKEHRRHSELGFRGDVFACMRSYVTTPFDMLINQQTEIKRQKFGQEHGTCGMGIHTTLLRSQVAPLTLAELYMPPPVLKERLRFISDYYRGLYGDFITPVMQDAYIQSFMRSAEYFIQEVLPYYTYSPKGEVVLFEGAQGLLLDKNYAVNFPHLTPTNTGIRNMAQLGQQIGITRMQAVYVSRTYLTRHGAGPLPGEKPMPEEVVDLTNKPNHLQGALRYAPLDIIGLRARVAHDMRHVVCPTDVQFAFTCADQIPVPAGAKYSFLSTGPTHSDVKEF